MRFLILFFALLLSGCTDDIEPRKKNLTPEQVSLGFFTAIYVTPDLEQAKTFVDKPLQNIMAHYHLTAQVQRHMLNLRMTNVTLEVDEINIDFFRKFTDDVKVKVKLTGERAGRHWVDDRTIRLKKSDNNWVIVALLDEKRTTNG